MLGAYFWNCISFQAPVILYIFYILYTYETDSSQRCAESACKLKKALHSGLPGQQARHFVKPLHLMAESSFCPVQITSKPRTDVSVTEADLLAIPKGPRTEACLRNNCVVGVQYLEAWLGGMGCVPLYNLMEDAATAEICRTQVS